MSIRAARETVNLADLYDQELMPWNRAFQALGTGSLGPEVPCFLCTIRPNGRPHSAGVGVAEHDGEIYFTTVPGRESRATSLGIQCAPCRCGPTAST